MWTSYPKLGYSFSVNKDSLQMLCRDTVSGPLNEAKSKITLVPPSYYSPCDHTDFSHL